MSEAQNPDLRDMEPLSGKRLALVGFSNADAEEVSRVLDGAGAFCRAIRPDHGEPGTLSRSFDGVIIHIGADSEAELKAWSATGKPILAAGPYSVLTPRIAKIRSHAVDCVGYPCAPEELLMRAGGMATAPMPGRQRTTGTPVVLIADDDPSIRALVRATLTSKRMECHVAEDGAAAIRATREIRPSVVVLDVNMPQMNGFEVLSTIRSESANSGVAVLMLTGCDQETDTVRGFGLGADDYLVKPFNPTELAVRVERLSRTTRS